MNKSFLLLLVIFVLLASVVHANPASEETPEVRWLGVLRSDAKILPLFRLSEKEGWSSPWPNVLDERDFEPQGRMVPRVGTGLWKIHSRDKGPHKALLTNASKGHAHCQAIWGLDLPGSAPIARSTAPTVEGIAMAGDLTVEPFESSLATKGKELASWRKSLFPLKAPVTYRDVDEVRCVHEPPGGFLCWYRLHEINGVVESAWVKQGQDRKLKGFGLRSERAKEFKPRSLEEPVAIVKEGTHYFILIELYGGQAGGFVLAELDGNGEFRQVSEFDSGSCSPPQAATFTEGPPSPISWIGVIRSDSRIHPLFARSRISSEWSTPWPKVTKYGDFHLPSERKNLVEIPASWVAGSSSSLRTWRVYLFEGGATEVTVSHASRGRTTSDSVWGLESAKLADYHGGPPMPIGVASSPGVEHVPFERRGDLDASILVRQSELFPGKSGKARVADLRCDGHGDPLLCHFVLRLRAEQKPKESGCPDVHIAQGWLVSLEGGKQKVLGLESWTTDCNFKTGGSVKQALARFGIDGKFFLLMDERHWESREYHLLELGAEGLIRIGGVNGG